MEQGVQEDARRLRGLVKALLQYLDGSLEDEGASDNPWSKHVDKSTTQGDPANVAAPASIVGMDRVEFRSRRKAAGLTMAKAARLLGVTERTVWRWEHGCSRIDPWKAQAIRETLVPGLWAKIPEQDKMSKMEP